MNLSDYATPLKCLPHRGHGPMLEHALSGGECYVVFNEDDDGVSFAHAFGLWHCDRLKWVEIRHKLFTIGKGDLIVYV